VQHAPETNHGNQCQSVLYNLSLAIGLKELAPPAHQRLVQLVQARILVFPLCFTLNMPAVPM
jgi:hypothetical protein